MYNNLHCIVCGKPMTTIGICEECQASRKETEQLWEVYTGSRKIKPIVCPYCSGELSVIPEQVPERDSNGILCQRHVCKCGRSQLLMPHVDESGQVYLED